ncbi:MAG TPA: energy transducer TonB, partial [Opitutaceae bacterium]|nr:energy transducer TonB [Opitutaceae bacterium]
MHTCLCRLWPVFLALTAVGLAADPARTDPRPIGPKPPQYPAELVETGKAGSATIELRVKSDGTVADAKVKAADDPAFGKAALEAVQVWTFEPAKQDGVAVERVVVIPFNFTPPIEQQLNTAFKRKLYVALPEAPVTQKEFGKLPKAKVKLEAAYPKSLAK